MIAKITRTVLIADDSEPFITRLSHILASAGHRACHAPGGREAIDRLKKGIEGIDLLVVDLEMPGVDGFGVLEWLKENGCGGRLPALAVTGASEVSSVIGRVRELGAAGIISKDFTPEEIVSRVNRLLFPEKNDGRVMKRVPVSVPAELLVGENGSQGVLRNISSTGAFLHSRGELLQGSVVRLRFALPGTDKVMDLKGIVKWSTGHDEEDNYFSGSGIMFTGVPSEEQEAMDDFIASEAVKQGMEE